MEYFPKTDIKHHEKSKDFNYQDWYSQISEDFKINTKDLEIENDSRFNYDAWFKKLNHKDKIKAEYSKIFKNIEITENVTEYIAKYFFENEFNGDLEIIDSEGMLEKSSLGDEDIKLFEQNLTNLIFENNPKKELSKNQIHYFKQIIKHAIEELKKIKKFIEEEVYKKPESQDKLNNLLSGSGLKIIKNKFRVKILPFCIVVHLSDYDYKNNLGDSSRGSFKCPYFKYNEKIITKRLAIINDELGISDLIENHELKHAIYDLITPKTGLIDDLYKLQNVDDYIKIQNKIENWLFSVIRNETISFLSVNNLDNWFNLDSLSHNYIFVTREHLGDFLKKLDEKDRNVTIKLHKKIENHIEHISKKYVWLVNKLFLKYKQENKSMYEFEAIIRNIAPQKYKRLCIFLGIDPEKFEEIYDKDWTTIEE